MNRLSYSQISNLSVSRHLKDVEQKPMLQPVLAKKVLQDEPIKLLSMKDNPLIQQSPKNRHQRVKSSLEINNKQNISSSTHDRKFNRSTYLNQAVEHPHSPDIKQFDVSPSFRRTENMKLLDSYENRVKKLSQENGILQRQIFSDQQRYNQMMIDFQTQIKKLEQKLQSEYVISQQQKELIQNKNDEIQLQNEDINKCEMKLEELENKQLQQQQEYSLLKQQYEQRLIDIENLKNILFDNQQRHSRECEELRIKIESTLKIQYEMQIKDIESQSHNQQTKLNDQLFQEQQRISKLNNQNQKQQNELNQMSYEINEQKNEREKILDELQKTNLFLQDSRRIMQELSRENETLKERLSQQEKNHQNSLLDMKNHYEYMRKSQTEREIKELTLKFQSERMNFDIQTRSLNQKLNDTENKYLQLLEELKLATQKYQGIEIELKTYLSDNEHYKRIKESEMEDISIENAKLRQQLQDAQSKYQNATQEMNKLYLQINDIKNEIEIQKRRYFEMEEQLNQNHEKEITSLGEQFNSDRTYFEKQISDLKQRNQNLEQILKERDEQILMISKDKLVLQGEIEQLNQKLINLTDQKERELNDYQNELDTFKNGLKEQQQKLISERNQLEQALKVAKQKCSDLEGQILELQHQIEQVRIHSVTQIEQKDIQIKQLNSELIQFKKELQELKTKYQEQSQQITELQDIITEKDTEINELKQTNESDRAQFVQKQLLLENKLQQQKQQYNQFEQNVTQLENENQLLNEQVKQQEIQIDQNNGEFKRRESNYIVEITNLKEELEKYQQNQLELSNHHSNMGEQIQQLELQKQELNRQLEIWKKKYYDLEEEFNEQTEEINLKTEYFSKLEMDQKDWEMKMNAEKSAYEAKIQQLEEQIEHIELRCNQLQTENRSVEDLMGVKVKEIESLKQQLNKNSFSNDEYNSLKEQNKTLTEELQNLEQSKLKFNTEKQQLKKQIEKLQGDLELKDEEVQQAYELINKRRIQQDEGTRKMEQLLKDIQNLNHDLSEANTQLSTKNDLLVGSKREIGDLQQQIVNLKKQLQNSQDQFNQKNKEFIDKIAEIDAMKAKYDEQWKRQSVQSDQQFLQTQKITTTTIRNSTLQVSNPLHDQDDEENEIKIVKTKSRRSSHIKLTDSQ